MSILTLFPAPPCGVLFISVSHVHPWKSQFKYLISASISWNFSVILRFALSNYITLLNVAVKMVFFFFLAEKWCKCFELYKQHGENATVIGAGIISPVKCHQVQSE